MRSLLALSFVALLAPLHASSSSVEDSELNALSARLRARNLQVDRLQRVSPHLVEVTIKGETVYATPDGNIMLFGQAISFDQNERPTNLTTAAEQPKPAVHHDRACAGGWTTGGSGGTCGQACKTPGLTTSPPLPPPLPTAHRLRPDALRLPKLIKKGVRGRGISQAILA